jgi:hypothetical protein
MGRSANKHKIPFDFAQGRLSASLGMTELGADDELKDGMEKIRIRIRLQPYRDSRNKRQASASVV